MSQEREECLDCGQTEWEGHRADCPSGAAMTPTPATASGRALLDWLRDYRHFQPNELTQVRNRLRGVQREARAAAIAQVRAALPMYGSTDPVISHFLRQYRKKVLVILAAAATPAGEGDEPETEMVSGGLDVYGSVGDEP